MNTWLHRISHCYEVSKPLLDQDYLTIGFWKYVKKYESHSDPKFVKENFETDLSEDYGKKFRPRFNLKKFLFEFKIGDRVLVPSWGEFSVYEITHEAEPITKLLSDISIGNIGSNIIYKDGSFYDEDKKEVIDLGFFVKVKEIKLNIPRSYCQTSLISRMKIRNATANVSDLDKEVTEAIKRFEENKPIDFHVEAVSTVYAIENSSMKSNLIETMTSKCSPDQFEELVQWYLKKIGADATEIPAKNEPGKSDHADADVVAIFEALKCIIYVQVKQYKGETSDWAIKQIAKYKKQFEDVADEYNYLSWVISSGQFSKDVSEKAKAAGVRLIDGDGFAEMLIDVGLKGINTAFAK